MSKEFIVVKNVDGTPAGKKEVTSKVMAANVASYIVNGNLIYGLLEYLKMQEDAKNLPEIEQKESV